MAIKHNVSSSNGNLATDDNKSCRRHDNNTQLN